MTELEETRPPPTAAVVADMAIDQGLRRFMLGIYNKVALGLVLSAGLAYVTSSVPTARDLMFKTVASEGASAVTGLTVLGSLVAVAPIFMLLGVSFARRKPTPRATSLLYWSVVAAVGASLGVLVLAFTGASIATTLAISGAAFGGLSLFGYATRRDLTAVGSFLTVGLIGLLVALGVNIFLHSPAVAFVANLVGVGVFAGLIAYDTQRLKLGYSQVGDDPDALSIASSYGALNLYLNFINLFQFLLMMMSGGRR